MMNTRRSRWKMSFDILSQRLLWCSLPSWSFVKANRTYLAELTRNVNVGWGWWAAPLGSLKCSHCLSLHLTHRWRLGYPVGPALQRGFSRDRWLQMSCTLLTLIISCTLSKCSALLAHMCTHTDTQSGGMQCFHTPTRGLTVSQRNLALLCPCSCTIPALQIPPMLEPTPTPPSCKHSAHARTIRTFSQCVFAFVQINGETRIQSRVFCRRVRKATRNR